MDVMVELTSLTKRFGHITAVDNVTFQVKRGEVLGFLGPNGAGKSTTMKCLTCFLSPTRGTAKVCGHSIEKDSIKVRQKIGYLPEGAPAYPDMTAEAFLKFCAEVRGLKGAARKQRFEYVVDLVGIRDVLPQPIETLSKGYKRRVGLAQAIIHDPEVLILDEPTDGLDPNQKHEVRTLISEMARNKAIILSTHILEEVDAVCTRAIIIAKGRVIFDGTPQQLEAKSKFHNAVTLVVDKNQSDAIATRLKTLENVDKIETLQSLNGKEQLMVFPHKGRSIVSELAEVSRDNKWRVTEMRSEAGRLDEVFRTLTLGEGGRS